MKSGNYFRCAIQFFFYILIAFLPANISAQKINFTPNEGDFCMAASGKKITIIVDKNEFQAVKNIASIFQNDIKMVTGIVPEINHRIVSNQEIVIIAGTLGRSPIIDALVKKGKLNVAEIQGKWESSLIEVVDNPAKGIKNALVIAGSDKRGTIYGLLEISHNIGVSPWYWWADIPVVKHPQIYIKAGRYILEEPKIKYRGFFINDEAPALSGWAKEKFGGFNHQFYAKVFELLIRMKGNYLWPAMWGNAFNDDDSLNQKTADDFGVVMGTSHHEPMVRAHDEWRRYGSGPWNYEKNEENLKEFWTQGIKRMGTSENIISLGMRGDGDMPMTEESNIALLERIVKDQRNIIGKITGKAPEQTPQMWALYKEVQEYYDKGMRVPADVTLLLCDDNWGNIRKLPDLNEKARSGGYGIYYHFDYVGDPRNYKWVNTNPIARVWEQMHLAYEYGVKQVWLVNVGDIKPMEFPLQFFLDYAWNPEQIQANQLNNYTLEWCGKQFGKEYAEPVAKILTTYLKFNSMRKPELLSPETYSIANYLEAETIVKDYNNLVREAELIQSKLPNEYHDAFYQLVLHPVLACANLNELYVTTGKNHWYANQGRALTSDLASKVHELYVNDSMISLYYNKTLAGGKWNHMMDQTHIGYTYWQQPPVNTMPEVVKPNLPEKAEMGIAVEESSAWWPNDTSKAFLPVFNNVEKKSHYFEIFNRGKEPFIYRIESPSPSVIFSSMKGNIVKESRIWVNIDWQYADKDKKVFPIYIYASTGQKITIYAKVSKTDIIDSTGFVNSGGYISMEAEHFTSKTETDSVKWQVIPNLGRTLSGITTFPVTAREQKPLGNGARLEYIFHSNDTGKIMVNAYLSPTLNFNGKGLRYAVSIDNETPQIINIHSNFTPEIWSKWVSNNIALISSEHHISSPGKHILKYWMINSGPVLQKLVIDFGSEKPSYLGPPESFKF